MKIIRSFEQLRTVGERICVAIGVFDGVHRGHQAVIGAAIQDAQAGGGTAVVLTFDPHPLRVLAPAKAPPLLTSTEQKLDRFQQLGVPVCLLVPFTPQLADTEPEPFLDQLFQSARQLQTICVGHAFRFGRHRKGSVQTILAFGRARGVRVDVVPPVTDGGEIISSTATRKAVAAGDLVRAERMLGRPFSVLGQVERGDGLGRQLGLPTANIRPQNDLLPPHGVYAVRVRIGTEFRAGVANLGVRPTVAAAGLPPRLEVHLFDYAGDLYGRTIEVSFIHKLREERKLASTEELQAQIRRDAAQARELLAGRAGSAPSPSAPPHGSPSSPPPRG